MQIARPRACHPIICQGLQGTSTACQQRIILIFEDETLAHGETLRNLTNTRSNGREQQSGEQSKERKLSELAPQR